MKINELIRINRLWTKCDALKYPVTLYVRLIKSTEFLEKIRRRDKIMVRILIFMLMLLVPVLFISLANSSSVIVSSDTIYYQGHKLAGNSLSFNTGYGTYGYELSLQQTSPYQLNQINGNLTINNKIDISSISFGLYRKIELRKFYIKPILGAVHSTVNVNSKFLYHKHFEIFGYHYPLEISYEAYNSKTGILPLYGVFIGYSFNRNLSFFYSKKEQIYSLNSVGIEFTF